MSGIAAPAAPAAAAAPAEPAKLQSLKEDEMKALKEGMAELAKTATQFAELGKVADKGVKLGEKMAAAEQAAEIYASKISAAGAATDSYAAATANLAQNYALISNDIANVAEETRAYKQSVNEVGQKLASLNSVYELQLQAVNAQVEAQKHVAAATKEAADAQLAFANGAKQLQKQVTDLNGIYGNMLNALA
jgi:chromosome segregation ATPase